MSLLLLICIPRWLKSSQEMIESFAISDNRLRPYRGNIRKAPFKSFHVTHLGGLLHRTRRSAEINSQQERLQLSFYYFPQPKRV